MNEIEKVGIDLEQNPKHIWEVKNIPILFRGVLVAAPISGEGLATVIDEYSKSINTLDEVCKEYGVKLSLIVKLSEQYPTVAEELNFAERVRARLLESLSLEPYAGTIEDSMKHIMESRIDKHGETHYIASAAKVSQLKARSERLMRAAAIADRKRYGEKESEGTTVQIFNQQNNGSGPASFEELQNISVTELLDRQQPGQL